MKKVAIIILSFNNKRDLINCIKSCLDTEVPLNWLKKIIVVDNNSGDNIIYSVKNLFPSVKFILNSENLGFSGGMNVGINFAVRDKTDAIMLLNQDTLLNKDSLRILLNSLFSLDKIGLVGPVIKYKDKSNNIYDTGANENFLFRFAVHKNVKQINFKNKQKRDFLSGACILVKKEVFEKIGIFDEKYFLYYEDDDLCKRIRDAGFSIYIDPMALISHLLRSSVDGQLSPKVAYYSSRNLLRYSYKHNNKIFFSLVLLYSVVRILLFFTKRLKVGLFATRGFADFFINRFGKAEYFID